MVTYYLTAWHLLFYYVLSDDDDFPAYEEVVDALKDRKAGAKILSTCRRRFWLLPASDLRSMMPGFLAEVDKAYQENILISEDVNMFSLKDKQWRKMYAKYAAAVLKSFRNLAQKSTYIQIPKRATSRLAFLLHCMHDITSMSIFPTASFIRDLESAMKDAKLAFAEVLFLSCIIDDCSHLVDWF